MIRLLALAGTAAVAALLFAAPARAAGGELIFQVTEADARLEGDTLHVSARGLANTGGYSNPRLVAAGSAAGGVLIVDFLVDPPAPNTIVTTALAPHRAALAHPGAGDIRAVEVRGANASVRVEVR